MYNFSQSLQLVAKIFTYWIIGVETFVNYFLSLKIVIWKIQSIPRGISAYNQYDAILHALEINKIFDYNKI